MTCPACKTSIESVALRALEGEAPPSCRACAERDALVRGALATKAAAQPRVDPRAKQAHIRAVMAEVDKLTARPEKAVVRRIHPAVLFAPLAAAAAVVTFVATQSFRHAPQAPEERAAYVSEGQLSPMAATSAVSKDTPLEAPTDTHIKLKDDTEVLARAGGSFVLSRAEDRVHVERGTFSFRVKKRTSAPFFVTTQEASVRVVGTQFDVVRDVGHHATRVVVQEGLVEVTSAKRPLVRLGPGDSVEIDARAPDEVTPEPVLDAGTGAPSSSMDAAATPASPTIGAEAIRVRLQRGDVAEARHLLRQAQSSTQGNRAELAVVEAEVLVAERQYGAAVDAYLTVTKKFPKSPQAEASLFAAAQMALRHEGRERAKELFMLYLAKYPSGRFQEDAERTLDVLNRSK